MNVSKMLFLILASWAILLAGSNNTGMKISYISANMIYISKGSADGLQVNDTVEVRVRNKQIAIFQVSYLARHSASCKVLKQNSPFHVGDPVFLLSKHVMDAKQTIRPAIPVISSQKSSAPFIERKNKTRIRGYLGLQWYQFMDRSKQNFNFNQPTVRFKFKADHLWGSDLRFNFYIRSRYNQRQRAFSNGTPKNEWNNRLYSFTLAWEPAGPVQLQAGRIISNVFSGLGYIDGLQAQYQLKQNWKMGGFAGIQPQWQYNDYRTSIQKYGLFLNYLQGTYGQKRTEITLAASGAYHGSVVSREYLYLQSSYASDNRWNLYQSLELDINRAWRQQRSGSTFNLSGLYLSGQYRFTNAMSAGFSLDNRQNYWTYDIYTLADSLFDDAFRQGLRINASARVFKDYLFYVTAGVRTRTDYADYTFSGAIRMTKNNFIFPKINLSTRISGFSNYFNQGINPSLRIGKYFKQGHALYLSYGNYIYQLSATGQNKLNQWVRLNGQIELPARLYLTGTYSYEFGDDRQGHTFITELGYRF